MPTAQLMQRIKSILVKTTGHNKWESLWCLLFWLLGGGGDYINCYFAGKEGYARKTSLCNHN